MMIATHYGTNSLEGQLSEHLLAVNETLRAERDKALDENAELCRIVHPLIERERDVIEWARDKGIFDKATPASQHGKTLEEVQELTDGLAAGDMAEIEDAIGDIIVTLIIQAHMNGLSAGACLDTAYNVIKGRKGKMVNGVFVKESDL